MFGLQVTWHNQRVQSSSMAPIFWLLHHNSNIELKCLFLSVCVLCLFLFHAWLTNFMFETLLESVTSPLLLNTRVPTLLMPSFSWAPQHLAASLTSLYVSCYYLYSFNNVSPRDHASHINLSNSLHNCKLVSTNPWPGEAKSLNLFGAVSRIYPIMLPLSKDVISCSNAERHAFPSTSIPLFIIWQS